MDGRSSKALMRKGAALFELGEVNGAAQVLSVAMQETKGKDIEVLKLLQQVQVAKGKGKGRGNRHLEDPNYKRFKEYEDYCTSTGGYSVKDGKDRLCREPSCTDKHC